MKKVAYFIIICLCLFGIIYGIGQSIYLHLWGMLVSILALGIAAIPTIYVAFRELVK